MARLTGVWHGAPALAPPVVFKGGNCRCGAAQPEETADDDDMKNQIDGASRAAPSQILANEVIAEGHAQKGQEVEHLLVPAWLGGPQMHRPS